MNNSEHMEYNNNSTEYNNNSTDFFKIFTKYKYLWSKNRVNIIFCKLAVRCTLFTIEYVSIEYVA